MSTFYHTFSTCAGFSPLLFGGTGACPKRETCERYLVHTPRGGYPQQRAMCTPGEWRWYWNANPSPVGGPDE